MHTGSHAGGLTWRAQRISGALDQHKALDACMHGTPCLDDAEETPVAMHSVRAFCLLSEQIVLQHLCMCKHNGADVSI